MSKKKTFVTLEQLKEIDKTYPTPYHLYDEKGIRENAKRLKEAFSWNKGYREYFAVKATPNPYILKILKDYGCGVDCASMAELMMGYALDYKPEEIMFSSNDTPAEEYAYANEIGATINLDDITHIEFLDKILDGKFPETMSCRYNPGGYVSTSQLLSTLLAPQNAMGQTFLNMTYNDKKSKTESYLFEPSLIPGGTPLAYENLYIITSNNTASASEIVINCLRPYLKERLLQVGTATFGKNVAQSLFTDEQSPQLELWLTTAYLSNAEGFQDYFDNGLQPDYELAENYAGELGELGTAEDMLLAPVFTRMATGSFPAGEDTATETTRSNPNVEVTHCSISKKPKLAKNNFH